MSRIVKWDSEVHSEEDLWVCPSCGEELHSDCVGEECPSCGTSVQEFGEFSE